MSADLLERAMLIINDAKDNGREFPPFQTIKDGLGGLSRDRTRAVLRDLQAKGLIYRSGPNYSFKPIKVVEERKEKAKKTTVQKFKSLPINWPNLAMALVMCFVGIGAIRMSVFHSQKFLYENFYSYGVAYFAACVFVLFEVGGIDLGIKFLKEKGRRVIGVAMITLGVISMLFSIWSTIGGLYSERAADLAQMDTTRATATATASKSTREWDSIQRRIETAEKAVESERSKRDGYSERLNRLKEGTDEYYSVYYAVINADKALRSAEDRLNEVMILEAEWLEKGENIATEADTVDKAEETDFYRWVGGRVFPGIRADLLEFWLSCLPAILYDTLATLATAVVLWHLPIRIKREDE